MILNIINILEIILGVILVGLVLLQSKGTGLGSTFGGDMGFYSTKRGAEKILFIGTIVIGSLFVLLPLVGIILS